MTSSTPRIQGWEAAQNGLPSSACPYKVGTRSRNEWRAGFWNFLQGKSRDGGHIPYRYGEQSSRQVAGEK